MHSVFVCGGGGGGYMMGETEGSGFVGRCRRPFAFLSESHLHSTPTFHQQPTHPHSLTASPCSASINTKGY